MQKHHTI